MNITKIIQWDMGHRILNHRSVCRGLHGHRYKAEITVSGALIQNSGKSEEGMVMDFSDIKKIALEEIHEKLDHGFMVWEKDDELLKFFGDSEGHKPVIVPFTPTAENVAIYIYDKIKSRFKDRFGTGLHLHSVKLWETPSSFVIHTVDG
tara:strand:+ start:981 stop:1427 length:447 start_codon:yes stop_codon:yes gene_type:complete